MPPEKKYSIEPYKGFYTIMREVAGKKELVVVTVYKKGRRGDENAGGGARTRQV
jgi:hypothetical protein